MNASQHRAEGERQLATAHACIKEQKFDRVAAYAALAGAHFAAATARADVERQAADGAGRIPLPEV